MERTLPQRAGGLVTSEFTGEFVVVNTTTGEAHALSDDAALVWRSVLDGSWPELPAARVEQIVAGFNALGLLESGGVSRRTVLKAGAMGGASLALLGVTSMMLPTAAMAASVYNTVSFSGYDNTGNANPDPTATGTYYLSVPADGQPVQFSLYGAGGGAGGATGASTPGGTGGNGTLVTGTITNNTGQTQTLTVYLGQGGGGGHQGSGRPVSASAFGASGLSPGGTGGAGGNSDGAGGGGGGASAILAGGNVLVVAGAGGGGGGGGGDDILIAGGSGQAPQTGGNAGTNVTSNPNVNGSAAGKSGGGGGGGGTQAGDGGASGEPGYGGYAGSSGWASTSEFTISNVTITPAGGSQGGSGGYYSGNPGTDGSATFQGYNIVQVGST